MRRMALVTPQEEPREALISDLMGLANLSEADADRVTKVFAFWLERHGYSIASPPIYLSPEWYSHTAGLEGRLQAMLDEIRAA